MTKDQLRHANYLSRIIATLEIAVSFPDNEKAIVETWVETLTPSEQKEAAATCLEKLKEKLSVMKSELEEM
jgi:hypothetical protein